MEFLSSGLSGIFAGGFFDGFVNFFGSVLAVVMESPIALFSTIFLVVVAVVAAMQLLRLPVMVAYIVAGVVLGPKLLGLVEHQEIFETLAHIGVAFLLFLVGIGLNTRVIKEMGKVSVMTGVGQVVFTTAIGFLFTRAIGFDVVSSLYLAIALAFSSTIVMVKLISDRGDTEQLYGKISIGLLIVQDVIVMAILMTLSLMATQQAVAGGEFVAVLVGKILAVVALYFLSTKILLPRISKFLAESQELLLIFAIARCLVWGTGLKFAGFSFEIGALLAGMSFASLPWRFEIVSRIKPLRDFFIMIFFVLIGTQVEFATVVTHWDTILILSAFVVVGNPLIVMAIMGVMGYKRKTGFMTGLTCAQISEFSFILMGIGFALGHVTDLAVVQMTTVIGVVTITGSSVVFAHADSIYHRLSGVLKIFEKKRPVEKKVGQTEHFVADVVLIGANKLARPVIQHLGEKKNSFVVVDSNPQVIERFAKRKIPVLFGDAGDAETLEMVDRSSVSLVVSTVKNFDVNEFVLQRVKKMKRKIPVILAAQTPNEAMQLYADGADYIILPQDLGGRHLTMLLEEFGFSFDKFLEKKQEELKFLQKFL